MSPSKQKEGPDWNPEAAFLGATDPATGRQENVQAKSTYSTYIRARDGVGTSGMKPVSDWTEEETDDPHNADRRNFYKVEKWSRDGLRVMMLLYAGNNLDKARRIFERTHKHRPRYSDIPSFSGQSAISKIASPQTASSERSA